MASGADGDGVVDLFPTLLRPSRPGALATDFEAVNGTVRASLLGEAFRCAFALKRLVPSKRLRTANTQSAHHIAVVLAAESGAYGDPAHVTDFKPVSLSVCALPHIIMRRVGQCRDRMRDLRRRIGDLPAEDLRALRAACIEAEPEIRALTCGTPSVCTMSHASASRRPPPSPAFLHRHAHALPWLSRSHERTVGAGAGYVVHRLHVRQTRPRSAPTW